MNQYAPCPKCGGTNSEKMSFTWWGGILGPKILTHVKCRNCAATFNGKTGKDNTNNIIIYCVAVFVGVFVLLIGSLIVMAVILFAFAAANQ